MNLEIKDTLEMSNLLQALEKGYVCYKCDIDNILHFSKEDVYATMTRIPTKKNNLEIAFWVKCPVCNKEILIYRTE